MTITSILFTVLLMQAGSPAFLPGLANGPYGGPLPEGFDDVPVLEAVLFELGEDATKTLVVVPEGRPPQVYAVVNVFDGRPQFMQITPVLFTVGEEPPPTCRGVQVSDLGGGGTPDLIFKEPEREVRYRFNGRAYKRAAP